MEQASNTFWEGNCYKSYGYVQTFPSLYHQIHLPDPPELLLKDLVAMFLVKSSRIQNHTKLRQLFFIFIFFIESYHTGSPQGFSQIQILHISHKKAFNLKKQYTKRNKNIKNIKIALLALPLCTIPINLGHAGIVDLSV